MKLQFGQDPSYNTLSFFEKFWVEILVVVVVVVIIVPATCNVIYYDVICRDVTCHDFICLDIKCYGVISYDIKLWDFCRRFLISKAIVTTHRRYQ